MKKLLVAIAILGAAGWAAWALVLRTPERRACARLVELCPGDAGERERACRDYFAQLKKVAPGEIERVGACMAEGTSCGAVLGCQAGGVMRMGLDFGKGLLEGLEKSLK